MKGKISAVVFKVMAVVSALAIGGGYVAWRQIEADKANKRERIERAQIEEEKEEELELMVGSKSMGGDFLNKYDFSKFEGGFLDSGTPVEEATFLPGSKSISMPVFRKRDIANDKGLLLLQDGEPEEGKIPDTPAKPDMFPSSKSGILRLREKEVEPPRAKLLPGSKSFFVLPEQPE